ncbi:MAG: ISAzo13 family transposase [Candidatus Sulfotelmatobacter sp.]
MWSAAEPAAPAVVVFRRKKNARHNRRSPLPARPRYRGRSYDRLTLVSTHYHHHCRGVGQTRPNTVARLLHDMGYSLRVNQKQISTSCSPNRNLQFEYLAELRYRFQRRHLPIVSVDSKKRELVGNFKNPGRRWEMAPRCVFDHDFRTDSIGVAIPYGIYDLTQNRGALVVGVSHDTPAFAAHAIAHWWHQEGSTRYFGSRQLLILADTGCSNSCRCYAWKTEVQSQLANSFALAVTVAHYPTPVIP